MTHNDKLIVIGRVVKPFGIRGEIRIAPYTESFEAFENSADIFVGNDIYSVISLRFHKGGILAFLNGIETRDQAQTITGELVSTQVVNLPPKEDDEVYWHELIGLRAKTVDGRDLGAITGIIPTGANDVLEIEGSLGEILLPVIDDVVIEINVEEGVVIVDPLEGLVPDA